MKRIILKNSISVLMSLTMAAVLPLGHIGAYADTYTSVLGGEEYVSSSDDIATEQGVTILDYEIESEKYDDHETADGNVISDERLYDSVIEYDELGTFVQKFNTTVKNTRASISASEVQYETIVDDILSEYIDSIRLSADYKYDDEEQEEYATYAEYKATYKAAIQSYNNIIDNLSSQSTVRSLKSVEKSLTCAAQSLMISYSTLELTRSTLSKSAELYQALYDTTALMVSAGTATEADLMSALNSLQSAENALDSIVISQQSVYSSLCILLGVDPADGYTIGTIPDPDTTYFASRDTDADMEAYINSYSSVVSTRHQSSGSSAGAAIKEAELKEIESEARISYQSMYDTLRDAQNAYDAALSGYESTSIAWSTAQSKKSLGMLSTAEYLEEELSYISGEGDLNSARISLFSAINSYEWGLIGVS